MLDWIYFFTSLFILLVCIPAQRELDVIALVTISTLCISLVLTLLNDEIIQTVGAVLMIIGMIKLHEN